MTQSVATAFDSDPRTTRILDIVAKETDTDRGALVPEATVDGLGIASLDLTLAVFQLETAFDIEIPVISDRPGVEFGTLGELVAQVIAAIDRAAVEKRAAGTRDVTRDVSGASGAGV